MGKFKNYPIETSLLEHYHKQTVILSKGIVKILRVIQKMF